MPNSLPISTAPEAIKTAFAAVTDFCPAVVSVTFSQEGTAPDDIWDVWTYRTAGGDAPSLAGMTDVGALEDALDAAWEAGTFPLTYSTEA